MSSLVSEKCREHEVSVSSLRVSSVHSQVPGARSAPRKYLLSNYTSEACRGAPTRLEVACRSMPKKSLGMVGAPTRDIGPVGA